MSQPRPRDGQRLQSGPVRRCSASIAFDRAASVAVGPFHRRAVAAQPDAAFRPRPDRRHPRRGDRGDGEKQAQESPETKGRVSRLKDGRIGRLGWKGQTANIEDFVLNACAVEVGLEVPGHHQADDTAGPEVSRGSGLDLTADECSALVAYVRSLPRPVERRPAALAEAKHTRRRPAAFATVGCANCHTPSWATSQGIYSDLLLHDMGQEMGDDGSYDDNSSERRRAAGPRITPGRGRAVRPPSTTGAATDPGGATRQEWRTPPLWGFRDSGPYLHDGRAQTLEQAVAMHGGQGRPRRSRFFQLSPRERLQVEAFLKSLVAPPAVQLARDGD